MQPAMTIDRTPEVKTGNLALPEVDRSLFICDPQMVQSEIDHFLVGVHDAMRAVDVIYNSTLGRVCRLVDPEGKMGHSSPATFTKPSDSQLSYLRAARYPAIHHKDYDYTLPFLSRLETLWNEVQGEVPDDDITWPSEQAYEDAKSFIQLLPLSDIHAPKIYFAHDGEITFLWKVEYNKLHVDLGLYGNGTYSYFATNDSGKKLKGDDVNINQALPDSLADMLKV